MGGPEVLRCLLASQSPAGDPKATELILVVNSEIFSSLRRDSQAVGAPRVHHDPVKRRRLHLRTFPGDPGRKSGPWTNGSTARSSGAATSSASFQTRPLIDHAAAERWQLRRQLASEAHRLALAVMWGRYGDDEAERELRTMLAYAADCGRYKVRCDPLAADMLEEALADLAQSYMRTIIDMKAAALDAMTRRQSRFVVEVHAAAVAATAYPPPPPHLVRHAIDEALGLYAWRRREWQQVERAA
jgi:hypothetical protein